MAESIAAVLGRIPSGIFIVTAKGAGGTETGMLASWVQQVSFDPPSLCVSINRKRYLNDWLAPGEFLAVNIVSETQKNLLSHFGKGFAIGEPAFQGLEIERSPAGLPVLPDSTGWLEGKVVTSLDVGDHSIKVIEITSAGQGARLTSEKPFIHIRKNGLNY